MEYKLKGMTFEQKAALSYEEFDKRQTYFWELDGCDCCFTCGELDSLDLGANSDEEAIEEIIRITNYEVARISKWHPTDSIIIFDRSKCDPMKLSVGDAFDRWKRSVNARLRSMDMDFKYFPTENVPEDKLRSLFQSAETSDISHKIAANRLANDPVFAELMRD